MTEDNKIDIDIDKEIIESLLSTIRSLKLQIVQSKGKYSESSRPLDIIQSADIEIPVGTNLWKYKYSFTEVDTIIREALK